MTAPTYKETLTDHYLRPEVKEVIQAKARDGELWRAGNGDFRKWYKPIPETDEVGLFDLTKDEDYFHLVNHHRTLYWTLNYFDPRVRNQRIPKSLHSQEGDKLTIGERRNTRALSLAIDIDQVKDEEKGLDITNCPEIKRAVECAAQFACDELRTLLPNSIHPLFSGGGVYVYIHHKALLPREGLTDDEYDHYWYALQNCFNRYIKDIEARFFELYPEHKGKVKFDAINNAKRVFKTIFSVHKKYPLAVIPLDPKEIKIDFEKAKIPLRKEVIEEGRRWYESWDLDKTQFIAKLNQWYKEVMDKYNQELEPGEIEILEKVDQSLFPPCIKNVLNRERFEVGRTRAITLLCTFLGQCGWNKNEAEELFKIKAKQFKVETSNIFESWFKRMKCPTCKTIQTKGSGFPRMDMGELGICTPDEICKKIAHPIGYVKEKNATFQKKQLEEELQRPIRTALASDIYAEFKDVAIAIYYDEEKKVLTRKWVERKRREEPRYLIVVARKVKGEQGEECEDEEIFRCYSKDLEHWKAHKQKRSELAGLLADYDICDGGKAARRKADDILREFAKQWAEKNEKWIEYQELCQKLEQSKNQESQTQNNENLKEKKEELEKSAEEFLLRPDILAQIDKVLNQGIINPATGKIRFIEGEVGNRQLTFLNMFSPKTPYPQFILITGPSGSGKTNQIETVLLILPDGLVVRRGYITGAAIRYGEQKAESMLYLQEYRGADVDIRLLSPYDEGFIAEIATKDPETGQMTTTTYDIKCRGFITTSVAKLPDPQLLRRVWLISSDESEELTKKVVERQTKFEMGSEHPTDPRTVEVIKTALSKLEPKKVLIPFAGEIAEIANWGRSNITKIFDLVKIICNLYQRQRPVDEKGRLIALPFDLYAALRIGHKSLQQTLLSLSDKHQEVLKAIAELGGKAESEDALPTTKALAKYTGIPQKSIYVYCSDLIALGYVIGTGTRPKRYEATGKALNYLLENSWDKVDWSVVQKKVENYSVGMSSFSNPHVCSGKNKEGNPLPITELHKPFIFDVTQWHGFIFSNSISHGKKTTSGTEQELSSIEQTELDSLSQEKARNGNGLDFNFIISIMKVYADKWQRHNDAINSMNLNEFICDFLLEHMEIGIQEAKKAAERLFSLTPKG
jgi:energy-coupling factor transporter ATP-binding protein EcfA2